IDPYICLPFFFQSSATHIDLHSFPTRRSSDLRHRYEFNRQFEEVLTDHGLIISGVSPDKNFVEIVELANHPWFLACQFHPEFKSKPLQPHPLFASFVHASYENRLSGHTLSHREKVARGAG